MCYATLALAVQLRRAFAKEQEHKAEEKKARQRRVALMREYLKERQHENTCRLLNRVCRLSLGRTTETYPSIRIYRMCVRLGAYDLAVSTGYRRPLHLETRIQTGRLCKRCSPCLSVLLRLLQTDPRAFQGRKMVAFAHSMYGGDEVTHAMHACLDTLEAQKHKSGAREAERLARLDYVRKRQVRVSSPGTWQHLCMCSSPCALPCAA